MTGDYPSFCNMKRREVFVLTPGLDASPSQGYPHLKFVRTHFYTWLERGSVRVNCLALEHNAMSPARARTRTARSKNDTNVVQLIFSSSHDFFKYVVKGTLSRCSASANLTGFFHRKTIELSLCRVMPTRQSDR